MELNPENQELTVQDLLNDSNSESISVPDIESLNIIINNNDCGDVFFQSVIDVLANDGFPFRVIHGPLKNDIHDSTIVTLDMLYSAGANTMIFAPYDNTRAGYSDPLALAMKAGFQESGISNQKIVCGQVGFRKDSDGNVLHSVPTPTEEAVGDDFSTSFVTISFGTEKMDPVQVAKGIESGLLRQKYFLDHYDTGSDLIYNSKAGEEVLAVANYFGTSVRDLCAINQLKTTDALEERAVINPEVQKMKVFNTSTTFQSEKNYSLTY